VLFLVRKQLKKSLGFAVALMTAISLAGCAPAATEPTQSATDSAQAQPLVVYAGRSEELVQPLIRLMSSLPRTREHSVQYPRQAC
jgi:ABC-type Fe3+-hydroxamate transport system substrate-binding protein